MIDFQNAVFLKLRPVPDNTFSALISPMFVADEQILCSFQTVRDGVVFTNKRIFAINVQGIVGKKKDFTSLPYSKIQAYSVETAGVLDLDSPELARFAAEDAQALEAFAAVVEAACAGGPFGYDLRPGNGTAD